MMPWEPMTEIEVVTATITDDDGRTFTQVPSPTCAKCGNIMDFHKRETVTATCRGVLFHSEEHGDLFSIDDASEYSWADQETWWACGNPACFRALREAGEDAPYEREFEGTVDWA
jgi:hypothetical protein